MDIFNIAIVAVTIDLVWSLITYYLRLDQLEEKTRKKESIWQLLRQLAQPSFKHYTGIMLGVSWLLCLVALFAVTQEYGILWAALYFIVRPFAIFVILMTLAIAS